MKKNQTFFRFINELSTHRGSFLLLILLGILFNVIMVIIPMILASGIDNLVKLISQNGIEKISMDEFVEAIRNPVIFIIISVIFVGLFSFLQELMMAKISEEVVFSLRKKVANKLKRLPIKFYDDHQVGDIMSRTTSDLKKISDFLINNVNQMISSFLSIVLGVGMMLYINKLITIVALAVMLLSLVATKWISNKNKEAADKSQSSLGDLSSVSEELYTGNTVIKAFNMQEEVIQKFGKYNFEYFTSFKKSQFIMFSIYPAIRLLNQLSFIISAILGARLVVQGNMSIGTLQAYLQYVNQISEPITTSSYGVNAIQGALAAMERIIEILDAEEEITNDSERIVLNKPHGNIAFEKVDFGYKSDELLLNKVSFKAYSNQMVAIVGPTGAGKTTLVKLLMRFYELDKGQILFDGLPINDFKKSQYRKMFGMVLQDAWLFDGTIAENIAYGKRDATMEEIISAAKAAQCDHFIQTLPDGYNTQVINGGESISQGQKQLITIARVLLVDPTIVILDEATSSVDTRTEVLVQQAMKEMLKGRTSFVIAHRLSTIVNADLILVMKEGNIVEQGTHEALIHQKGFYENLFNSQYVS